jgi:hypothetical protein
MALGRIDPELLRQLDEAAASGDSVTAVVTLRRTPGTAPDPAVVEQQVQHAVDRTIQITGERPGDVHVMGRLSVAYMSGTERFLREFVEQPEVVSAVANQTSAVRGAAPAEDPTRDGANGDGSAEDVLGTPVPAGGPASGRSPGVTKHRPH